jgi:hypothetical protein
MTERVLLVVEAKGGGVSSASTVMRIQCKSDHQAQTRQGRKPGPRINGCHTGTSAGNLLGQNGCPPSRSGTIASLPVHGQLDVRVGWGSHGHQ